MSRNAPTRTAAIAEPPLAAALPEAAPEPHPFPALVDDPAAPPAEPDAHGHDPSLYQWVPVLRRRRSDGWSPDRQRKFIEALADRGSVTEAARVAGMTVQSCYRLRREPGQDNFRRAWEAALHQAAHGLIDLAFDRAIHGSDEPVFDREGHRVGRRMKTNDRLLMFLLRAHFPERFRHAHRDVRDDCDAAAPAALPVAQVIERLLPEPPADPVALLDPDALEIALQCADICEGKLPHWHRDAPGDNEPPPPCSPREIEIDRVLEWAKLGYPEPPDPGWPDASTERFLA